MKNLLAVVVALVVGVPAVVVAAGAEQQPGGSKSSAPGMQSQSAQSSSTKDAVQTIDCPPEAGAKAAESLPSKSPVGTPSGTGSGSGAEALPGKGDVQKVEGQITQIDSSRTSRAVQVGDVKVWVEPTTAVLVDCKKATVADLKPGTFVKAAYEEKAGRNIAKVIEASKEKQGSQSTQGSSQPMQDSQQKQDGQQKPQ